LRFALMRAVTVWPVRNAAPFGAQQPHELDQSSTCPQRLISWPPNTACLRASEPGEHGLGGHHARRDADDADVVGSELPSMSAMVTDVPSAAKASA
jgi:hypothetical protein